VSDNKNHISFNLRNKGDKKSTSVIYISSIEDIINFQEAAHIYRLQIREEVYHTGLIVTVQFIKY